MTAINIKSHFPHSEYYPFQEDILNTLEQYYDQYNYFILEAPTGTGKTPIAKAFSEAHETCDVLTHQIRLQNQYQQYNFKTASGRDNFMCLNCANKCSMGICMQDKNFFCEYKPTFPNSDDFNTDYYAGTSNTRGELYWTNNVTHCPYWQQKMDALKSGKVVHNYAYYLHETNYVGDFGSPEAIVADECHHIESLVMGFVHTLLTDEQMEKIGITLPNFTDAEKWISWLLSLKDVFIPRRLKEIETELDNHFKDFRLIRERDNLTTILYKVTFFLDNQQENPEGWLILPYQSRGVGLERVEFRPLFVNKFVKPFIFKDSKKHLIMSGTILDFKTFRRSIGLDTEKCLEIKVPSPFPVENRLIYKANIGRLDAGALNPRNPDNLLSRVTSFIDEVLDSPHFRHTKGIIHTTSYKLADYIVNNCSTGPRMLTHKNSQEATEILDIHKNTIEPTILVSPSMTDGVDLYDDLSRIQIPIHVPYLNTTDPVIATRRKMDIQWYYWMTGTTLIQSCGRSVRHMKDYATTIIPDSRISYFLYNQLGTENVPDYILGSNEVAGSLRSKDDLIEKFNFNLEFES